MIDGLGAELAPTGLTVMRGRPEGIRLPMIDIDQLPDQEPRAEHPEYHFGDVAEVLREACALLDQSWVESDAAVRAAKNMQPEIIDDTLELTCQAVGIASFRRLRSEFESRFNTERMRQGIDILALIVRHGVREHVKSGSLTDEVPIPGYQDFITHLYEWEPQKNPVLTKEGQRIVESTDGFEDDYEQICMKEVGFAEDLKNLLVEKYGIIYNLTPELIGFAAVTVASGIDQATSFAGWLEQVHEEQDGDFRAYLQMLAADLLEKDDTPSVLAPALETLQKRAENSLHRDFIETLLRGELGEHQTMGEWMQFLDAAIQLNANDATGGQDRTMKTLMALCYLWPEELQEMYKAYTAKRVSEVSLRIKSVLQNYLYKQRLHPTQEKFDRAIMAISPRQNQKSESGKRSRGKKAPKGGGRVTPSLKSAAGTDAEIAPVVLELGLLKSMPTGNCVIEDPDAKELSVMVAKYCAGSNQEDGLDDTLHELIEQIRNDPRGRGTKRLIGQTVSVEGRTYNLWEAMVRKNHAVNSSGTTAYRTRIIYSIVEGVNGRTLAVREILHKNDVLKKYQSS